jgi:hypothetical protein
VTGMDHDHFTSPQPTRSSEDAVQKTPVNSPTKDIFGNDHSTK